MNLDIHSVSSTLAQDPGFREAFGGVLLLPDDEGYHETRLIWNGMFDRRPAMIAQCRNASDVSAVIRLAVRQGIGVTVRGGGHNVAGTSVADHTVLIDLSPMRTVTVDPRARTASAGGGALLGDLDTATVEHCLMCPAGVYPLTGLGGLALGGGYGWRARKWGLTCDHILAAEVVLADGSIVAATPDQHPELLWAIRGGGGEFGVVTGFSLRLRPAGPMYLVNVLCAGDDVVPALEAFGEFTGSQPDDMHILAGLRHARDGDAIPAADRTAPVLDLLAVCSADDTEAVAAAARLTEAMNPAAVTRDSVSYLELQTITDGSAPTGRRYYTKSGYLSGFELGTAERLVEAAGRNPSPTGSIDIEYLLGAINDPAEAESAFPQRDAPFMVSVYGSWDDRADDTTTIQWARDSLASVDDWKHRGGYVNYLSQEEDAGVVAQTYGEDRYARLAAAKRRYDPNNLFRGGRNVIPAASR